MDQANRPRTRGLEASEAEEDAKFVKQALLEPAKYIKKGNQKLRSDHGSGGRGSKTQEESDEEEKLFYGQPAYDDEESEVKTGTGTKRKRGVWRRGNMRRKAKVGGGDGGGEEDVKKSAVSAKLAIILKEELKPKLVPSTSSSIEHKLLLYKIGDIVCVQEKDNDTKYYAQLLGFHVDQFCERYASIRWLIPKSKVDIEELRDPLSADPFYECRYVDETERINMNHFQFVFRPPAYHFAPDNPKVVTRNKFFVYKNEKCFFDSPTATLTSADRRY